MSESSDDEKWKYMLMRFCHDVSSALTPIKGYGEILEAYLEKLAQQENIPSLSISPDFDVSPEMALQMLHTIRTHADKLRELNNVVRDKVGLGIGPFKESEES